MHRPPICRANYPSLQASLVTTYAHYGAGTIVHPEITRILEAQSLSVIKMYSSGYSRHHPGFFASEAEQKGPQRVGDAACHYPQRD